MKAMYIKRKLNEWLTDRYYDFTFWWKDRPFAKLMKAVKFRALAVWFSVQLLLLSLYSPKKARIKLIESVKSINWK